MNEDEINLKDLMNNKYFWVGLIITDQHQI
jgi:hypothetical protein